MTWFVRVGGWLALSLLAVLQAATLNVRDYGAKGDGAAKDTAAVQKAIDAAEKQGGGTVWVPAGKYLCGTVHLKSHVTLHLDNGATIMASPAKEDFDPYETLPFKSVSDEETTYFHYGLITAENVHHIAIVGQGTIDGNRTRRYGPKTIAIKLCQYVAIHGITVKNSPNYTISFWGTDYIDIDGVTILNGYSDGIDPDACRYVRIANCFIDCHDDAIVAKASPSMGMENRRSTEHLVVTNCILRSFDSCFEFGSESSGDFKDVTVSNCTMLRREHERASDNGIALQALDGAHIDGVAFSNITMAGVRRPILILLNARGRGQNPPVPGSIENVSFNNIVARGAVNTSSVRGIPGAKVRRVSFSNITITMDGGDLEPKGLEMGARSAYGFYSQHAEGMALSNFFVRWQKEDRRPAMVFADVKDLTVDGFRTDAVAGASPVVWLNNVVDAFVRGSRTAAAQTFLRVSGATSKGITAMGNDLTRAGKSVEMVDAPKTAVQEIGNAGAAAPGRVAKKSSLGGKKK